jgi:hypothetical protein
MPVTHLSQLPLGFGLSAEVERGGRGGRGEDVGLGLALLSSCEDLLSHLNHRQYPPPKSWGSSVALAFAAFLLEMTIFFGALSLSAATSVLWASSAILMRSSNWAFRASCPFRTPIVDTGNGPNSPGCFWAAPGKTLSQTPADQDIANIVKPMTTAVNGSGQ